MSERKLKHFINKYFSDKPSDESQFLSIIDLARRLQLDDIGKILVLKFLEKKLIEEHEFVNQDIVYTMLV